MRNFLYLFRVARVLARHDALFFLDDLNVSPFVANLAKLVSGRKEPGREGERLAAALTELGPFFIKFGQALAVRSDLVGEEIAEDLSKLQDRLEPFPTEIAKEIIAKELGRPVEQVFADFSDIPVAAASIAQVHFATDREGNKLAVKVLRPGVAEQFRRDISMLYFVARMVNTTLPRLRRLKLRQVVEDFEKTVRVEMDLRMEAAAASELQHNMAGDAHMKIPAVYWDMTSTRVLTLERIHGIRIDDVAALKAAGHDIHDIVHKASAIFFHQVFRDGFFHADMHPGNLFVGEDGRIIAVDFGIMGRIDRHTRVFLAEMLRGFLNRDYQKVADVHFEAGYIPADQDRQLFAQACRAIGEPLFGKAQKDISIALLMAQLFRVTEDFNMETQPQLILLQKTMMLAEGLGRRLDPDVNFWLLSQPLIEEWARENLGPKARVMDAAETLTKTLERLKYIPDCITPEGIRIHPDTIRAACGDRTREIPWQRLSWAAILIACAALVVAAL